MNISSSDSSDSDDATPPKLAKRTTVRGLSRLMKQKSEGEKQNQPETKKSSVFSVYSSAGSLTFEALQEENIQKKSCQIARDEEENKCNNNNENKKKQTRRKATRTSPRKDVKETDIKDDEIVWQQEIPSQMNSSIDRENSPTPPPTPDQPIVRKTKRKMKGVTAAMKILDSVHSTFQSISKPDEEDDCSIIDIVSPVQEKDSKKHRVIKVRSRSGIVRFNTNMTDDFSELFHLLAEHEGVDESCLSICHNDVPIQPYDTPTCIDLKITDILDSYISKEAVSRENVSSVDDPDVISLQIQGKDPKSRHCILVKKNEPLERMMRKYANCVSVPYSTLTFTFDGESLHPDSTAETEGLEEEFCIDVTGV